MKIIRGRAIYRFSLVVVTVAVFVSCGLESRSVFPPPMGLAALDVGRHTSAVRFVNRGESREFIPREGRVELEPGNYLLEGWLIDRTDADGRLWTLKASRLPNPVAFEIAAGEVRKIPIGESLKTSLIVYRQGRDSSIAPTLTAGNGEHVDLVVDGKQASPAPVRIYNSDLSYDRTFPFAYG